MKDSWRSLSFSYALESACAIADGMISRVWSMTKTGPFCGKKGCFVCRTLINREDIFGESHLQAVPLFVMTNILCDGTDISSILEGSECWQLLI